MDTKFKVQYELLGNKCWLEECYLEKNLSLNQIAKIVGCTCSGVRSAIARKKIPLRTRGEGLRNAARCGKDYFVFNKSVIEGCLLGDGGLKAQNRQSDDSFPVFTKGNIHYDHIMFVAKLLFFEQPEKRILECANYGFNKHGRIFRLSSLTHNELLVLFKEWYPAPNYKKVVPKSLEINATVLLHWFLDDGYSYFAIKKNKKYGDYRHLRIQFATQSFIKEDLDFLCKEVKNKLGLIMTPRYHQKHGKIKGSGYFVELSNRKEQVEKFYEIIGPPPVSSLTYKWKKETEL